MVGALLRQYIMAIIGHATRDIPDGIAVVEMNKKELAGGHAFQLELGLHEIIGTNDPTKIQLLVWNLSRRRCLRHVRTDPQ
ncbi:hypothetical protein NSPZN2_40045 [Nitrospira defluvii]|uniref:Uncharacterized protein n=1 Tax=Nitrospira defluvii TaxID=330214 RepID=A0ABM8RQG6_9BACT|nr:hypothetical protein NSPZN2_40045 [Nitrospira defluvii]